MKQSISLKTGINFAIVIFSIASVAISGIIMRNMATDKIVTTTIQKNGYIAESIAINLDLYLNNAMETVNTAAAFSSDSEGDIHSIQNEIFRIYDNFSYFDLIFFMDKDGKILFSKPGNPSVTEVNVYQFRDYYEHVKADKKNYVSGLFLSTILNRPHFVVASPVFSNGEWIGLIGCGIPLQNVEKIVSQNQENFDGDVWVMDQNGSVVISPFDKEIKSISTLADSDILSKGKKYHYQQLINQRVDLDGTRKRRGENHYVSTRNLRDFGWMIMLEQSANSMQLETDVFNKQIMNALLLVLTISAFFSVFFTNSILRPIQRLVKDVESIDGDQFIIPHYEDDIYEEVEELTNAFAAMGNRIQRKIQDVEKANSEIFTLRQQLIDIFENITVGIIVSDNHHRVNFINKRVEEITGYYHEELMGLTLDELGHLLTMDLKSILWEDEHLSESLREVEIELKTQKGDIIPTMIHINPLTTSQGEKDGLVLSINDLSEIKFLEDEIMREDRIRALGELSASIIHDIGNPLAGITNLLEVLKEGKLSEDESQEAFAIIENEVIDLNFMVRDFLDYTKSKGMEKERIELNEFIREIITLFKIEARKREIVIHLGLPNEEIYLDVNRMEVKQAFINIVKNAIYAVEKEGVISLKILRNSGRIDIHISDNGMGIDEDNIKKIFNPFYTTKETGTGLGLPIAYKSIKSNGGYITVGSVKNKGTNFVITFLE